MHIRLFMEHQSGRLHGGWTNTCGGKTSSKTSKTSQHLLILGHRTSPGSTKSVWKNCSGREASSQYSNKHLYISDMFSYLISDLEWTTLYVFQWVYFFSPDDHVSSRVTSGAIDGKTKYRGINRVSTQTRRTQQELNNTPKMNYDADDDDNPVESPMRTPSRPEGTLTLS